jgi:hypothetical protein
MKVPPQVAAVHRRPAPGVVLPPGVAGIAALHITTKQLEGYPKTNHWQEGVSGEVTSIYCGQGTHMSHCWGPVYYECCPHNQSCKQQPDGTWGCSA